MTSTQEQSFTISIDGQEMHVCFHPNKFGDYGHFEFSSPHQPKRRIIVSETGYRSHFTPMWAIEEAPDVSTYAHELARVLARQKGRAQDDEEPAQLGLF